MTGAPRPPPRPPPAPVSVPTSRPFSVTIRLKTSPTERTPSPGFQSYFPAMTRARPANLSDSVPASLDRAVCVVCARSGARLSTAAIATAHAIVLVRIVRIDISCSRLFSDCCVVTSSLDDEVDLHAGPKRQRGHADRRADRKGLREMLRIRGIQRDVVTHAREKHTDAHDIIETLAGRLEKRREILEEAVRLGRNTSRHQLARRRVLADLTAEIDETAGVDGLGIRAHRRREFRRGNCGFAHGELLCTVGSLNKSLSGSCRIFSSPIHK